MFTHTNNTIRTEAARIVARFKAVTGERAGFLDLLDDKGYVPAEPKIETSLDKAAITLVAAVLSMSSQMGAAYADLTAPTFGFMDLLAAKGHGPALNAVDGPLKEGANDNWPVPGKAAA